jgi:hypothetical protein
MTQVTPSDFTRINNDVNGNPRYVVHFTNLITKQDEQDIRDNYGASLSHNPLRFTEFCYDEAVLKAKKIGGKRYTSKNYGGGIVFTSQNVQAICDKINQLINQ